MRVFIALTLLLQMAFGAGVDGLNPDGSLNRSRISKFYFEGEFDKVSSALEAFRKLNPEPSREDKIYTYKYLSVIYAARPETQAKAESYMYQLLRLMPTIELMDLYISDNIEAIFNSVRVRFEKQQHLAQDPQPATKPGVGSAKPPATTVKGNKKSGGESSWIWWTAGGLGVAVAVVGLVHISGEEKPATAPTKTLEF